MKNRKLRQKILNMVMTLDVSKGHLKWKVSDLGRLTKTSRPLIYYHFGKTKREILNNCVRIVADDYFGLSEERANWLIEGRVAESLLKTRQMFLETPAVAIFYLKWRAQSSPLQKQLIQIEERYQAKLKRAFPHLTEIQILIIHGFFHGIITAPFMTDEALAEAVHLIEKKCRLL